MDGLESRNCIYTTWLEPISTYILCTHHQATKIQDYLHKFSWNLENAKQINTESFFYYLIYGSRGKLPILLVLEWFIPYKIYTNNCRPQVPYMQQQSCFNKHGYWPRPGISFLFLSFSRTNSLGHTDTLLLVVVAPPSSISATYMHLGKNHRPSASWIPHFLLTTQGSDLIINDRNHSATFLKICPARTISVHRLCIVIINCSSSRELMEQPRNTAIWPFDS